MSLLDNQFNMMRKWERSSFRKLAVVIPISVWNKNNKATRLLQTDSETKGVYKNGVECDKSLYIIIILE